MFLCKYFHCYSVQPLGHCFFRPYQLLLMMFPMELFLRSSAGQGIRGNYLQLCHKQETSHIGAVAAVTGLSRKAYFIILIEVDKMTLGFCQL